MPRFLRYLLLHLLVLTGLLWLGWRYARLSDREVRLLGEVDRALQNENRRLQFANRTLFLQIEQEVMTGPRSTEDLRQLDVIGQVKRTADKALMAFHQLDQELIKRAGSHRELRYAQPRVESALIWALAFDEDLQARID